MIKALTITAYCFIFIQGWFIGIPLICYLLFSWTEFWSVGSIAALFGLAGLILSGVLWIESTIKNKFLFELLALFLLLTPLIERLLHFPISTFNYPTFIIPVSLFLVFYTLHLLLTTKFPDHERNQF